MISVRPATVGDSDQIARAHIRTWQAAYAHVLPAARRFYERFGFVADGGSRLVPVGDDYPDARPVEHVRYTLHDARRA
jgi:hypothetical protein